MSLTTLSVDVTSNYSGAQQGFTYVDKAVVDMRNQILSLNNVTNNMFKAQNFQTFVSNISNTNNHIKEYSRNLSTASTATRETSRQVSSMWDVFGGSFAANMATQAVNGFLGALDKIGKEAFDAYVSYENMTNQLTSLSAAQLMNAGSATNMKDAIAQATEPTKELMAWMTDLALISIFREEDIANGLRTAQVFGFNQQEAAHLVNTIVDWGSATGATGDSMNRVIYALGQINSLGHLTAAEVRQLANAGVPAMEYLSQATGKTTEELRKLMRQGAIPASDAIQAIVGSMDRDFAGAAERMSHSMNGLVSSFKDLLRIGARNLLGPTFEAVQPYLDRFVTWARSPEITGTIQAFGDILAGKVTSSLQVVDSLFTTIQDNAARFAPIFDTISGVASGISSFFEDLVSEAFAWGQNFFGQLASGMSSAIGSVMDSLGALGDVITYWLQPHSPPELLKDLDKWGKQTAEVWLDGWTQADFSAFEGMSGTIEQLLRSMFSETDDKIGMLDTIINTRDVFKEFQDVLNKTGQIGPEMFEKIRVAAGPVGDLAVQLAQAYAIWQQETDKVAAAQAEVDNAARRVAEAELVLADASKEVTQAEEALAQAHEQTIRANDDLERATERVEAAQNKVAEASYKVTQASYALEEAQNAAADAQNALAEANASWQREIDPLDDQLDSLGNRIKDVKDEMRALELQKIVEGQVKNKQDPMDKELALLELQQMELEKVKRTKESERDAATRALREQVDRTKAEVDAQQRKIDLAERGVQLLQREVDKAKELQRLAEQQVKKAEEGEKVFQRQIDAAKKIEDAAKKAVEAAKEEEKAAKNRLELAKQVEKQAKGQIQAIADLINIQKEDNKLVQERIKLEEKLSKEKAKGGKGGSDGAEGPDMPVLSPIDLSVPEVPKIDLSQMFALGPEASAAADNVRRFLDVAFEPVRLVGGEIATVLGTGLKGIAGIVAATLDALVPDLSKNQEKIKTIFSLGWANIKAGFQEDMSLLNSIVQHGLFTIQNVITGNTDLANTQFNLFSISAELLANNLLGSMTKLRDQALLKLFEWTDEGLKMVTEWVPKLLELVGTLVTNVIDTVGASLPGWVAALKAWGFQLLEWVVQDGPKLLASVGKLIGDVLDSLWKATPGLVEALAQWGKELFEWVIDNTPGLLQELLTMTSKMLGWIMDRVPDIAKQLGLWAVEFLKWVPGATADLILALGQLLGDLLIWITSDEQMDRLDKSIEEWTRAFVDWVIQDAWPGLLEGLEEFWKKISKWFEEVGPRAWETMKRFGRNMVDEIKKGFKEAWGLGAWLDELLGIKPAAAAPGSSDSGGGFERGTNYAPGGYRWVGERGPELMFVNQGAQVLEHRRSMSLLSQETSRVAAQANNTYNTNTDSGEKHVHIHLPPGSVGQNLDTYALAREIGDILRTQSL